MATTAPVEWPTDASNCEVSVLNSWMLSETGRKEAE